MHAYYASSEQLISYFRGIAIKWKDDYGVVL